MRRYRAGILALVLAVSLTACGGAPRGGETGHLPERTGETVLLLDQGGVTITAKPAALGTGITVYIDNCSGQDIAVQARSLDGGQVYALMAFGVCSGGYMAGTVSLPPRGSGRGAADPVSGLSLQVLRTADGTLLAETGPAGTDAAS
mgnify:CR=1 FL=1